MHTEVAAQKAASETAALEEEDDQRREVLVGFVGEGIAAGTGGNAVPEVCSGGEGAREGGRRGEDPGSMEELRGLMQSSLESTESIFEGCFKSAAVKLRQFQARKPRIDYLTISREQNEALLCTVGHC